MSNVVSLDRDRMRAPQHRCDALALLAFSHLITPADEAFAIRVAGAVHVSDEDRGRLQALCVSVGRARFKEAS